MNKNRGFLLLFALFSAILASVSSVADDLAGVMSVDAGTNGVVEFEMPFAPMEPIGPQGYVSGIFLGDGGELGHEASHKFHDTQDYYYMYDEKKIYDAYSWGMIYGERQRTDI